MAANWAPWLQRYIMLAEQGFKFTPNGDDDLKAAKELMTSWANKVMDWSFGETLLTPDPLNTLAHAYRITKDGKYLRFGMNYLRPIVNAIFKSDGEIFERIADKSWDKRFNSEKGRKLFEGLSERYPLAHSMTKDEWLNRMKKLHDVWPTLLPIDSIQWSYTMQHLPTFMAALDEAGMTLSDDDPDEEDAIKPFIINLADPTFYGKEIKHVDLIAHIMVSEGDTAKISLSCTAGYSGKKTWHNPPTVTLYSKADTDSPTTLKWPETKYDETFWFTLPLEHDLSPGEYMLKVTHSDERRVTCYLPVSTASEEVYEIDSKIHKIGISTPSAIYFEYSGRPEIKQLEPSGYPSVVRLIDTNNPSNITVQQAFFGQVLGGVNTPLTPQTEGAGPWRLDLGPAARGKLKFPNEIKYFAVSKGRLFTPSLDVKQ